MSDAEPREDKADPGPVGEASATEPTAQPDAPAARPAAASDETTVLSDSAETTVISPDSADTTVLPSTPRDVGPTGTTVMPKVGSQPGGTQWAGRAEVRPVDRPREPTPTEQWELGQRPTSGVVIPALITISVIILIGLIAVGAFALLRDEPKPAPTQAPTSAAPTSAAPTTSSAPTTGPATTGVPTVQVPVLRGLTEADALNELSVRGLTADVVRQPSIEMPAGFVITSDPNAGVGVSSGAVVRVVVSTGAPTTPPTSAPPTAPATETATASPPA